MRYEISIQSPCATKTYTRKRRDSAVLLFERAVYGVLKSRALLDRPCSITAMRRAKEASEPDCGFVGVHVQDMTIRFRTV